ncbi:hypothetical protein D3C81_1680220 [compost metagenome]
MQHTAGIIADINDESFHALLLQIRQLFLKPLSGVHGELGHFDYADSVLFHGGVDGFQLHIIAGNHELQRLRRTCTLDLERCLAALRSPDLGHCIIQFQSFERFTIHRQNDILSLNSGLFSRRSLDRRDNDNLAVIRGYLRTDS